MQSRHDLRKHSPGTQQMGEQPRFLLKGPAHPAYEENKVHTIPQQSMQDLLSWEHVCGDGKMLRRGKEEW